MKILMLTSWYPDDQHPNSGIFIQQQANVLSSRHEVVVVSSKVDYARFSWGRASLASTFRKNLSEHRVVVHRSFPFYNQLNYIVLSCIHTRNLARGFKPDLIIASIAYPGAMWGWLMGKIFKVPFLVSEHTLPKNNFRSFFHRRVTLFGLKRARGLLAVSHFLAREIQKVTRREVMVVPNIVDVAPWPKPLGENPPLPMQIGILGGMNTPVKGIDLLLEAMKGIEKDFVLHIGGAGKLYPDYVAMAEKYGVAHRCRFYGFVPPQEIPQFYSRLHFYVCASRYETFNVSAAEALAYGLPVVSTRCGGPEDYINPQNGILCEKENAESLREGIAQMMDTYLQYNADAMRLAIQEKLSSEAYLRNMDEVFLKTMTVKP